LVVPTFGPQGDIQVSSYPEGVEHLSPGLPLWATLGQWDTPISTLKGLDKFNIMVRFLQPFQGWVA
jgi:hypothetical protein